MSNSGASDQPAPAELLADHYMQLDLRDAAASALVLRRAGQRRSSISRIDGNASLAAICRSTCWDGELYTALAESGSAADCISCRPLCRHLRLVRPEHLPVREDQRFAQ